MTIFLTDIFMIREKPSLFKEKIIFFEFQAKKILSNVPDFWI